LSCDSVLRREATGFAVAAAITCAFPVVIVLLVPNSFSLVLMISELLLLQNNVDYLAYLKDSIFYLFFVEGISEIILHQNIPCRSRNRRYRFRSLSVDINIVLLDTMLSTTEKTPKKIRYGASLSRCHPLFVSLGRVRSSSCRERTRTCSPTSTFMHRMATLACFRTYAPRTNACSFTRLLRARNACLA
jgi:hypothetical protein